MKSFNIGLLLMMAAVVTVPVVAIINPVSQGFVRYMFYFCGLPELIGLIFVLVHIYHLKRNTHD